MLFLSLAQSDDTGTPPVWGVSFVGGGRIAQTYESFYNGGKHFHDALVSFGVPDSHRYEFFGQGGENVCYVTSDPDEDKKDEAAKDAFMASPNDCSKAIPVIDSFESDGKMIRVCSKSTYTVRVPKGPWYVTEERKTGIVENTRDYDGDGKEDVRGPADPKALMDALDEITKNGKAGQHVLLTLIDHGNGHDLEGTIEGGDGKFGTIYSISLARKLGALAAKGLIVHVDVEACASGVFVDALTRSQSAGAVCGSASTRSNITSLLGDPSDFPDSYPANFAKYGSQIKAFACSLVSDTVNTPYSSLDKFITDWESTQSQDFLTHCKTETGLGDISVTFEKLARTFNAGDTETQLRRKLLQSYRDTFVKTLKDCQAVDEDLESRVADRRKLDGALLKCLSDSTTLPYSKSTKDELRELFQARMGNPAPTGTVVADYSGQMVNRHLRFLSNADAGHLDGFKKLYCCLAYDFKAKKAPDLCVPPDASERH